MSLLEDADDDFVSAPDVVVAGIVVVADNVALVLVELVFFFAFDKYEKACCNLVLAAATSCW